MKFEITYMDPRRQPRVVGEATFANSSAYAPVLALEVGQAIEHRYTSAGYRRIVRLS